MTWPGYSGLNNYRPPCFSNPLIPANSPSYKKSCKKNTALEPDCRDTFSGSSQGNVLLLTPAIFGGTAFFILGFVFYGRHLKKGYKKFIFFLNIWALLASLGAAVYIYQLFKARNKSRRFDLIVWPSAMLIFFYGSAYNLLYSLYPCTFGGTIGKTPISQFLSFMTFAIGYISIGDSFSITHEKTGTQVLAAIEALFNLYVLSLIVSLVI
ncbi:MAG: hypothetical protein GX091_05215 [Peptococcaceae bacterium]|mgnify:CR=1 FL=1|nr:hypothetical protein [Peptococcaceae bacterium]